jgi:hypothetical protein
VWARGDRRFWWWTPSHFGCLASCLALALGFPASWSICYLATACWSSVILEAIFIAAEPAISLYVFLFSVCFICLVWKADPIIWVDGASSQWVGKLSSDLIWKTTAPANASALQSRSPVSQNKPWLNRARLAKATDVSDRFDQGNITRG